MIKKVFLSDSKFDKYTSQAVVLSSSSVDSIYGKSKSKLTRTGLTNGFDIYVSTGNKPFSLPTRPEGTTAFLICNMLDTEDGVTFTEANPSVSEVEMDILECVLDADFERLGHSHTPIPVGEYVYKVTVVPLQSDSVVAVPIVGSILMLNSRHSHLENLENFKSLVFLGGDDLITISVDSENNVILPAGIATPDTGGDIYIVTSPFIISIDTSFVSDGEFGRAYVYINRATGAIVVAYGESDSDEGSAAYPEVLDEESYRLVGGLLISVDEYGEVTVDAEDLDEETS
jgi:hypothetical protein